jgi:hypothetical protein
MTYSRSGSTNNKRGRPGRPRTQKAGHVIGKYTRAPSFPSPPKTQAEAQEFKRSATAADLAQQYPFEPDLNPWDRQPWEPSQAWESFRLYLRDPILRGNINAISSAVHRTYTTIAGYSRRYRWPERAAAYHSAMTASISEITADWAERHSHLIQLAEEKLIRRLSTMDVEDIPPAMVPQWLAAIQQARRLHEGLPTDNRSPQTVVDNRSIDQRRVLVYGGNQQGQQGGGTDKPRPRVILPDNGRGDRAPDLKELPAAPQEQPAPLEGEYKEVPE